MKSIKSLVSVIIAYIMFLCSVPAQSIAAAAAEERIDSRQMYAHPSRKLTVQLLHIQTGRNNRPPCQFPIIPRPDAAFPAEPPE